MYSWNSLWTRSPEVFFHLSTVCMFCSQGLDEAVTNSNYRSMAICSNSPTFLDHLTVTAPYNFHLLACIVAPAHLVYAYLLYTSVKYVTLQIPQICEPPHDRVL